jgi:prepilin-type N-terminal cleavage/methylation domain-containing protein/prepilin-type processing-associated H-X9-DG protein
MPARRKGFTLIELLVVIAIIAILAAMLFPVFARARESARKIQCLSNVKNIAMAVQVYLTDYDALPPREHRPEVFAYFDTGPGGNRSGGTSDQCGNRVQMANPFLRGPAVLDEYIKNRDIWRCPSAKMEGNAGFIVPDSYPGGWLGYLKKYQGLWGHGKALGGVCNMSWPPGWGDGITDTCVQGRMATEGDPGDFVQSIGVNFNRDNEGTKLSQVNDPSWYVACGDSGARLDTMSPSLVAYPDICWASCGTENLSCGPDWVNCSWTQSCGAHPNFRHEPEIRKPYTRHLGGSNIGFLDGHASWFNAENFLSLSPRYSCGCYGGTLVGKIEGLEITGPTSAAGSPADGVAPGATPSLPNCNVFPLY